MTRLKSWLLPAVAVVLCGCSQPAQDGTPESAPPATFAAAVQPIIAQRCAKCHVEESKGQYSLASLESALAGGKNAAAVVVPGNGEGSLLYQMVAGTAVKRMPPKGEPLSPDEVATIKQWIDSGAH